MHFFSEDPESLKGISSAVTYEQSTQSSAEITTQPLFKPHSSPPTSDGVSNDRIESSGQPELRPQSSLMNKEDLSSKAIRSTSNPAVGPWRYSPPLGHGMYFTVVPSC